MVQQGAVTAVVAFLAGFLSFLSPCVFPLMPFYIFYVTGLTVGDKELLVDKKMKTAVILHTLFFILGFSVIFVLLGLSFSFIGRVLFAHQVFIRKLAGVLIMLFGLNVIGLFHLDVFRPRGGVKFKNRKLGFFGSFLVGIAFGFTWTPCAGPILGSILTLASAEATMTKGAVLLLFYSLGVAVPFFISATLFDYFLIYSKAVKKYIKVISVISGIFLVIVGALVFTNYLSRVSFLIMKIWR